MKRKTMTLAMASLLVLSSVSFAQTPQTSEPASSLSGIVNTPSWLGANQLMVKSETEKGFAYYQLGLNGSGKLLVGATENVTEAVKSPDGTQVAYVNNNGDLFLLEVKTMNLKKISVDHEPKMELQFSRDGSKLYFLMGEKIDQMIAVELLSGKQTVLLADKVAYKSDLQISADGSKALYTITKAGTVNDKDESYAVDSKGTEPQLNVLDLTVAAAKPIQVTSSLDNKVFARFTQDNKIVYVSAFSDKEGMPLMQMNTDGSQLKTWVNHLEVHQVLVLNDGNVLVVGENTNFKKSLFKVETNGRTERLVTLPEGVTEVQATDLTHVVVTIQTEAGEKISTLMGNKFTDLTK